MKEAFVIGVDYGTDSVRSIMVDAANGKEISSSVFYYPRWRKGLYCRPSANQFRQHPLDYIEGLEATVKECVEKAGPAIAGRVRALSVDTTGSSPVAVDSQGVPLALLPGLEENPNGMFFLWKDHTSINEAARINEEAARHIPNYLKYVGGIYSSEWFWAKLLHALRVDEAVKKHCYSWVEHCDWIPFLLTGGKHITEMKRSACAAGHKALWSNEWNGLPPEEFLVAIDPLLEGFRDRLFSKVYTSDLAAGKLSAEWAARLGLSEEVIVGVGAFDAHMGAVGGQIEPYFLSKVIGTSTCDMLVAPPVEVADTLVSGICGQVQGSIIPGMIGMEAGQSAFGDAYAWFRDLLSWPMREVLPAINGDDHTHELVEQTIDRMLEKLGAAAAAIEPSRDAVLSVDWFNGRRTPDANQLLKGAITDLGIGSDAPAVFRSIVESTCFGARAIVERFREQGIEVRGLIGLGGVARKSPFIMQMLADVINLPIRVHRSEQTCALGAAMFAATAAGVYPAVEEAMQAMGTGFEKEYEPNQERVEIYEERYQRYRKLGAFLENALTK